MVHYNKSFVFLVRRIYLLAAGFGRLVRLAIISIPTLFQKFFSPSSKKGVGRRDDFLDDFLDDFFNPRI